jgi:ribonuclease Z
VKSLSRRDLLLGALVGAGAVLLAGGTIKTLSGNASHFFKPLLAGFSPRQLFHEELTAILLGTGSPNSIPGRSKPAVAVMADDRFFLVDCGGNVCERLMQAGIPPERISDLFITHHHSDHNSGFIDLLVTGAIGGAEPRRKAPLRVYGPTNTREIIGKFMSALEWDISIRIQHQQDISDPYRVDIFERNDGLVYDDKGIKVTAFTVDHGIVKPSLGYKFEYGNQSLVVSGDTLPCENMIRYASNADLLIHEAYSQIWISKGVRRYPHLKKTAGNIMNYHSSVIEAAHIAERAKVKRLVFTHLMPAPSPVWYFERSWAEGASNAYSGKIMVGRDLMEV